MRLGIRITPYRAMNPTLRRALISCLSAWTCAYAAVALYRLLALPQGARFTRLALEVSAGYAILYLLPPGLAVIAATLLRPGLRGLYVALVASLSWALTLVVVWLIHQRPSSSGLWPLLMTHDYLPLLLGALVFSWVYGRAFSGR